MISASLLHSIGHVSQLAAGSAVRGIGEGIVLAAMIALCLRLAPGISASGRFLVWTMAFLLLAFLPFVHLGGSGASRTGGAPVLHLGASWSLALAAVWALASVLRMGELIREALRLRGIWKRATPLVMDFDLTPLSGSRCAQLCLSDDVERPSVIGFFSPRILIPKWLLDKLSRAELQQIVLHESEHLRRGDDWVNLLQKLNLVLFPLNPVLVWIERRLCLEREMACDDGVVSRSGTPRAYATCLTNLAELGMFRRALNLSLGALERRSELARRVYRVLRHEQPMQPWRQIVILGGLVVVMMAGATGLAHSPELVSFAGDRDGVVAQAAASYNPPVSGATQTVHVSLVKAAASDSTQAGASFSNLRSVRVRQGNVRRAAAVSRARSRRARLELISDDGQVRTRMEWTVFRRRVDVTQQVFATSYAAVPYGSGWLLIQL